MTYNVYAYIVYKIHIINACSSAALLRRRWTKYKIYDKWNSGTWMGAAEIACHLQGIVLFGPTRAW